MWYASLQAKSNSAQRNSNSNGQPCSHTHDAPPRSGRQNLEGSLHVVADLISAEDEKEERKEDRKAGGWGRTWKGGARQSGSMSEASAVL